MTYTNYSQWKQQFAIEANKRLAQCEKTHRDAIQLLYNKIVEYTPIGRPELWQNLPKRDYVPGALKQSWKMSTGGARSTQTGRYTGDASALDAGYKTQSGVMTKIQNVAIYNDRPYAYRVEYMGWSNQAPNGMMRRANMEWEQLVKQAEQANK